MFNNNKGKKVNRIAQVLGNENTPQYYQTFLLILHKK